MDKIDWALPFEIWSHSCVCVKMQIISTFAIFVRKIQRNLFSLIRISKGEKTLRQYWSFILSMKAQNKIDIELYRYNSDFLYLHSTGLPFYDWCVLFLSFKIVPKYWSKDQNKTPTIVMIVTIVFLFVHSQSNWCFLSLLLISVARWMLIMPAAHLQNCAFSCLLV